MEWQTEASAVSVLLMHAFSLPKKEEEEDGPSMLTSFTQFLRLLLLYGNITVMLSEDFFFLAVVKAGHKVCWQQGGHLRLSWYLLRALGEDSLPRLRHISGERKARQRRGQQLEVTHFILRPKWMGPLMYNGERGAGVGRWTAGKSLPSCCLHLFQHGFPLSMMKICFFPLRW